MVKNTIILNFGSIGFIYGVIKKEFHNSFFEGYSFLDKYILFELKIRDNRQSYLVFCFPRSKGLDLLQNTDYTLLSSLMLSNDNSSDFDWSNFVFPKMDKVILNDSFLNWNLIEETSLSKDITNKITSSINNPTKILKSKKFTESNYWEITDPNQKRVKCLGILIPYCNSSEIKSGLIKFILSFPYAFILTNVTNHLLIGIIYIQRTYLAQLLIEFNKIKTNNPEIRIELSKFLDPNSIRVSLNNLRG